MALVGAGVVFTLILGAAVAGWRAVAPVHDSGGVPTIDSARSLTIAIQDGTLPLSGIDASGRPAGVHVAVARAVCERLAVTCAFALTPTGRLIESLDSGAVDMVAADLVATPDRAARVRFLTPHARTASLLVGRADSWPATVVKAPVRLPDPEALASRVLVSASGTDQARALAVAAPPTATLVLSRTAHEAVAALHRGDADAALLPLALALDALAQPEGADLVALGPPWTRRPAGGPVALAVATGDEGLARATEAALRALLRDGTLRRLTHANADPTATLVPSDVPPPGALPVPTPATGPQP
ncbi:amino acid ABC transporter substrate-binding protein [Roseospira marina]|uniref:Amino acid ABC transporter substrate-binding protein n=1 Tax=Roseospira marina TaxID=140057 RepID=A0A5M6ICB4_9PROT|nr:transporter substrate-binding domain-containing protein [Roseospira marina]KAA5605843.1 amino acid ABC transporter substrate-binding protein [Roseospira marina]MBB4313662.1 polar amino acid transport system substrate-binding protein [Roseospira marina]MBB5086824.1 polar amino acid transport system substrate-binding protein [Roseospira marina]